MKAKIIEIKNEDQQLIDLGHQMVGYRSLLDTIALQMGTISDGFWALALKIHPEIKRNEQWRYDHTDKVFRKTEYVLDEDEKVEETKMQ